jgi:hypothetical protein
VDEVELEAWKRRTRVAARQAPAYEPPMPARPGKSGDVFTAEVRAITADAA